MHVHLIRAFRELRDEGFSVATRLAAADLPVELLMAGQRAHEGPETRLAGDATHDMF